MGKGKAATPQDESAPFPVPDDLRSEEDVKTHYSHAVHALREKLGDA